MPRKAISRVRSNPVVTKPLEYFVDLSEPVEDDVIDIADFETFLKEKLNLTSAERVAEPFEIGSTANKV